MRLLQLNLIGLLLTTSSGCVSFPEPVDLERGACVVTYPDREICLEVPYRSCIAAMGEFYGVGSNCEDIHPQTPIDPGEPTPLYLDEKVIYSVGGTLTAIAAVWAGNKRRKRFGTK